MSFTRKFARSFSSSTKVALMGAQVNKGQPKHGVLHAPTALRQRLNEAGISVEDFGDFVQKVEQNDELLKLDSGYARFYKTFVANTLGIADHVHKSLSKDPSRMGLLLGGDHSIGTGSILGHFRARESTGRPLSVIWVDAHADINTPAQTPSGNIHGMPVAFLIKELRSKLSGFPSVDSIPPILDKSRLAYIGLRSVDDPEWENIKDLGIIYFTVRDIDRLGIDKVVSKVLDAVNPKMDANIHMSFDIDVLDPSIANATGTPEHGGLTLREGLYICEEIRSTSMLSHVDLVEVNMEAGAPGDAERTMAAALAIVSACVKSNPRYFIE